MNRDDITRMARAAGFVGFDGENKCLRQFADLIAAAEREACIQIVEDEAYQYASPVWAFEIVNDMKARGQS